jgi:hypothetical protein
MVRAEREDMSKLTLTPEQQAAAYDARTCWGYEQTRMDIADYMFAAGIAHAEAPIRAAVERYFADINANQNAVYSALRAFSATVTALNMHRFRNVSCSQCGRDFGPGDSGFSHCENHQHLVAK